MTRPATGRPTMSGRMAVLALDGLMDGSHFLIGVGAR
jgi:hypothetical protein